MTSPLLSALTARGVSRSAIARAAGVSLRQVARTTSEGHPVTPRLLWAVQGGLRALERAPLTRAEVRACLETGPELAALLSYLDDGP